MLTARRSIAARLPTALAAVAAMASCAAMCAPSSAAAAAVGEFEARNSSPATVTSVAVDPTANLIYAQENAGTAFFRYSPATNEWKSLASAPITPVNNGGGAYLNGKIYTSYPEDGAMLGVYDIASDSWTTVTNPLGATAKAGTADIAAAGGRIYMALGTTFISWDPGTETTTHLASAPKWAGTECHEGFEAWGGLQVYEGKIYGDQGNGCKGFAVYDIATDTWTELPSLPEAPGELGGGAVTGSALDPVTATYYTYGSYFGETLYRYDITAGHWTEVTFPFHNLDDGGMAYVSLAGQQGVYATYGEGSTGFTRYVTPGTAEADVSLSKSADVPEQTIGSDITYTLRATDNGPDLARGTTISDVLPANVSLVSATPSQGSCSGTSTVSCNLGTIANGAAATVTLVVKAEAVGPAANTATVATESVDPNPANDEASAAPNVIESAEADVALTEAASVSETTVGSNFTYTIKATDLGPNFAANTVVINALPTNVGLVSSTPSQGSCSGTSTVSCSLGRIENGATATVTIVVSANSAGTATSTASVSTESLDPNAANNSASASATIAPKPVAATAATPAAIAAAPPPPSARPPLLPARWLVPKGLLRASNGWVSGPLMNPNATLTLSGPAQLVIYSATGKGGGRVLARTTLFLSAGSTKKLFMHLNAAARAKLARAHVLHVQLQLTLTDQFGRQIKPTGLYLLAGPKAKHRKHKQTRRKS